MKELPQKIHESFCKRLLEHALTHRQTGRGPGRATSVPLPGERTETGQRQLSPHRRRWTLGRSVPVVRARARVPCLARVSALGMPHKPARPCRPCRPPATRGTRSAGPPGQAGGGAERRPGSRLRGRRRFRRRIGAGPRSSERAGSARKPSNVAGASAELEMRFATGMPAGGGARTPAPRRGESLRACCA